MKYLLLLTVAIQIVSNANGLPLPAGQIVKYRVPSKYFNSQNETAQESSSSLYNFLSQIHFGGSSPPVTINLNEIQSEDFSNDEKPVQIALDVSTKETEATENVTDQQMDIVKVNDDGLQSLIEKVVNDELKKLANEKSGTIAVEVIKHSSEPLLNVVNSSQEPSLETTTLLNESTMEPDQTDLSDTTESENLYGETTITATETEKLEVTEEVETTTNSLQSNGDGEDNGDRISDSLLNAVGDLLSSILGIDIHKRAESVDSNKETTTEAQPTETTDKVEEASTTPGGTEGEDSDEAVTINEDKPTNEVDVKIENLAIAQTSFATENIPEQVTETVRDEIAPDAISEEKPDSIEQRINQVMNLVKGTEGRLALEAMGTALDSTLIDKEMKNDVNDLAQIVYGTLKDVDTSFGLKDENEESEHVYSPAIHEDLIKNFEMGINDAVVDKNNFDHENFLPNSAKAALHYKHQDFYNY